jgi:hypothetical protein
MPRLNSGVPNMRKQQSRAESKLKDFEESCVNVEKVMEAKTERFKPRKINLTNFNK